MINFFAPWWLLVLLIIPALWWKQQRAKRVPLVAEHLQHKPQKHTNLFEWCIALIVALSAVAMAGPHWRESDLPQSQLQRARVIVMDMSQSMYSQDIAPSRFQQAFYKVTDLVKQLDEGYTGLVAYTDVGYVISPLTHDNNAVLTHIEHLSPAIMPTTGKNAAQGVHEALTLLTQAGFEQGDIVLVTTGISKAEKQALTRVLNNAAFTLSTYAVSTVEGAPLLDLDGVTVLDEQANEIVSKLVPERLMRLVSEHDGVAVTYEPSHRDIHALHDHLVQLRYRQEMDEQRERWSLQYINDGYWLLWPIAGLLVVLFRRGVVWSIVLMVSINPEMAQAQSWLQWLANDDRQGYAHFQKQHYHQAADAFTDPTWQGVALYQAGDYAGAVEVFLTIEDESNAYNLANALAMAGQLELALEHYDQVLALDPDHLSAKVNRHRVQEALQLQKEVVDSDNPSASGDSDQQESGEAEGEEEREEHSDEQNSGAQDNMEADTDNENVPEQGGDEQGGAAQGSEQSDDETQQQTQGESSAGASEHQRQETGEYDADKFSEGYGDIDFGTPSEEELEAIMQQLSELGEVNPVLNRLNKIQDDRSLLLRNLLLRQAERKQSQQKTQPLDIEW
ncbi:VWA domain-containing protein [Vibrio sp. WXL210]|uniref:VWA domain-containing protein n=1 Tax=Vibrio sp. WXL210 TaxID=3450709 RepID=UPI003EC4F962